MKRVFWVVVLAICSVAAVAPGLAAQMSERPTWSISAGLNSSTVAGDDVTDAKQKVGFAVGIGLGWNANARWSFHPELQYSQKGVRFSDLGEELKITLSYVELPVLFRLNGDRMENGARWYGLVGPTIAFKASCNVSITGAGSDSCDSAEFNVESMDYGAIAGAGVDFTVAGRALTLSGRYNYGMAAVDKDDTSIKNRTISVMLGWSW